MDGLKASGGHIITGTLEGKAPLQVKLLGAPSECLDHDNEEDVEEDSSEGIDSLPSGIESDDGLDVLGHLQEVQEASQADRDVVTFFRQFVPDSSAGGTSKLPAQPMAVLQSRYSALQHSLDKQAKQKSVKGLFRDKKWGDAHDLWWSSEVVVPGNMAEMWELKCIHSSGSFQLTRTEIEKLKTAYGNKDLLREICGENRISPTGTVEFKSKKNAQKSAALNLLLAIDLGELPSDVNREWDVTTSEEIIILPKARFELESIQYLGSVKHSEGEFILSPDNPCMIQCIVSLKDTRDSDPNEAIFEVKSGFHQNEGDSLNGIYLKIRTVLSDRGATSDDINSILSAIKESSEPAIAYEMTIPKWATSALESQLYLYELKFTLLKDGNEIPIAEAIGLDASAATRIGVICGCALHDGGHANSETDLSAEFTLASSVCIAGSNGNIRVTMCNCTEITSSEMIQQVKSAYPEINLDQGESPFTLAKCFNAILFDHGPMYGLGPNPAWVELLKRLEDNNVQPGNARTNLFLPLRPKPTGMCASESNLEIDWPLVWEVVHYKTKYVRVSPLGNRSLVPAIFALAVVYYTILPTSNWIYSYLPAITLIASCILSAVSSARPIPTSLLANRFLKQPVFFRGRVFMAKNEEPERIISLVPLLWCTIISRWRQLNTSVLKKIWQCYMRFPSATLVPAHLLTGVAYAKHEESFLHELYGKYGKDPSLPLSKLPQNSIPCILGARGLLVPELTQILPMPRDFLYLCQHTSHFMPKLERAHTIRAVASRLRELQINTGISPSHSSVSIESIAPLIDKATSIEILNPKNPVQREHERLEALGDSVLLFFIVLNLFAKLSLRNTECVLDTIEKVVILQGKNKILFEAAMQIGVHRVISVGNISTAKSWTSLYKTSSQGTQGLCTLTNQLSKKQLSDSFESILGATHLLDASGSMSIGFLNNISSFLSDIEVEILGPNSDDSLHTQTKIWFAGEGPCLEEGYPLNPTSGWAAELSDIDSILKCKHHIRAKLQSNATAFCQLLTQQSKCLDQIKFLQNDQTASLLLHCALFDDSLEDQECNPEFKDLETFAKLRDKIFHVGHAALQLSIVSDIYHFYPTSTSGDIHLMKVVLMSNDSLAYIFVKNRFHECLFDTNADAIKLMQDYIKEADSLGAIEWAKRGGWVLPGGPDEFQRRLRNHDNGNHTQQTKNPQYVGLAAGRLWGQDKKLPDEAADDLHFSLKCVLGALVLSFGVKDAWELLQPFFLEPMLLSPDELRMSYKNISPLVSNYRKGKR